jgi:molybdate transport system ATP-binding protein
MTDLFQKNDSLEQMVLSGFLTLFYTQPSISQKNSFSMAKTSPFKSPKNTPFKILSVGQQRLALIIRAVLKHIINFRRSRRRTR